MLKKIRNRKKQKRESLGSMASSFDRARIAWVAPERYRYQRGKLWFIMSALFVLAGVVWGVMYEALTFSIALIVFAVVYALTHLDHPEDVEVVISDIGIKIGARRYPYSKIKAFWLIYEPPYAATLTIRVMNDIALDIPIELNDQDPAEVREFLIGKIPELEGKNMSLSDMFVRIFKL